nr:MAG TPA: hypothetical protein [Caudoviricetes sp.]
MQESLKLVIGLTTYRSLQLISSTAVLGAILAKC